MSEIWAAWFRKGKAKQTSHLEFVVPWEVSTRSVKFRQEAAVWTSFLCTRVSSAAPTPCRSCSNSRASAGFNYWCLNWCQVKSWKPLVFLRIQSPLPRAQTSLSKSENDPETGKDVDRRNLPKTENHWIGAYQRTGTGPSLTSLAHLTVLDCAERLSVYISLHLSPSVLLSHV